MSHKTCMQTTKQLVTTTNVIYTNDTLHNGNAPNAARTIAIALKCHYAINWPFC